MEIDYKILWFEDTDESFDTLSRRTKRYVESKNLRCQIDRIFGVSDFNVSQYDLNKYELLVVDLQLSNESKGYDIIQTIRTSNYVNDILFYSSAGVSVLEKAMKAMRLEGVFLSERENRFFMDRVKQLIDKSVRRSENIINIRGIVLDETSEFDSQMKEITIAAQTVMSPKEIDTIRHYISGKLIQERVDGVEKLLQKYNDNSNWEISDLLDENDFTSAMRARLLNKILRLNSNHAIANAVEGSRTILDEVYKEDGSVRFADVYIKQILEFRNLLAHVKHLNAEHPVVIGEIDGVEYRCDSEFCTMMRDRLIRFRNWFDCVYNLFEKGEGTNE